MSMTDEKAISVEGCEHYAAIESLNTALIRSKILYINKINPRTGDQELIDTENYYYFTLPNDKIIAVLMFVKYLFGPRISKSPDIQTFELGGDYIEYCVDDEMFVLRFNLQDNSKFMPFIKMQ
jgi:hypothetical protein